MATEVASGIFDGHRLGKLRALLELIAALRGLSEPITTAAGLRQAVELLARLGALLGLEEGWLARVRSILADEGVFKIVLAIVQYLMGLATAESTDEGRQVYITAFGADGAGNVAHVETQALTDWLPWVLELLRFFWALRGSV